MTIPAAGCKPRLSGPAARVLFACIRPNRSPAVHRPFLPVVASLILAGAWASGLPVQAQDAAPPPTQAAANGPVHQLRIYGLLDETREAFHARFRDDGARIMRRYGFTIVGMWETRREGRPQFVYLLSWPDEATMRDAWTRFLADEEWIEIKRRTAAEHGRLMDGIEDRVLRLTDYSPPLS